MWKRYRSKRGIANGGEVEIERCATRNLMGVVKAEPHDEIVRMLAVHEGGTIGRLSGLKQQRISPVGNCRGLQAQHQFGLECALGSNAVLGRGHEPLG